MILETKGDGMKKSWLILLVLPLLIISGCSKDKKAETKESSNPRGVVVEDKVEKRSDIINNVLVGNTKLSFNNNNYDIMSEGEFNQNELWGTFKSENKDNTHIQLDAFDNTQAMYGELSGYELEGITWADAESVQYLNVMEEALQYSQDGKTVMFKARTGDVIFSVALFSNEKLTDEEILELKTLAKGIKVEYVEGQIGSN